MAKRYKVILAILFVVLVAVAAVVVTGVMDIDKAKKDRLTPAPGDASGETESGDYSDLFTTNTDVALPVLKTTIPDLYYTMDREGAVAFYELKDNALTELDETDSYEVTAECGSETLPAVIHLVETDEQIYGCGLFTNELYPDVNLYEYGFFEVTNMFPGFGKEGDLLLMIDVESDRFYSNEKVFSEIYTMNKDHETTHFLSENQRQPDIDARMRTDYKMFTNDILDQGKAEHVLFLSSRYYVSYAESGDVDILTSGGSGENVDNVKFATGLASLNFWRVGGDVFYFEKQNDGFRLVKLTTKAEEGEDEAKPEEIRSFEGTLSEDYLVSGSCLLRKNTGEVYNVLTDETNQIDYSALAADFSADLFVASPSGDYCVLRGANTDDVAAIVLANLITGKVRTYTDDMFGYIACMDAKDDGTVILSLANGKSATSFYQLIASL